MNSLLRGLVASAALACLFAGLSSDTLQASLAWNCNPVEIFQACNKFDVHNIANVGGGARTTSPGYSEPVGAESWVEGDYMSDEEGDYKEDWGEGSATTSSNVTPIPDHDLCGMYELHYINWWDYEDGYELDSGANGYTVYCS